MKKEKEERGEMKKGRGREDERVNKRDKTSPRSPSGFKVELCFTRWRGSQNSLCIKFQIISHALFHLFLSFFTYLRQRNKSYEIPESGRRNERPKLWHHCNHSCIVKNANCKIRYFICILHYSFDIMNFETC